MQFAPIFIAIFSLFSILPSVSPAAADLSDREVLDNLAKATNNERRADLILELQERSAEDIRIALEKIIANDAEPSMIRMQAICALAGSATAESVPVLLAIVEHDLIARRGFWACAIPLLGYLEDRRAVPLLLYVADLKEDHLAGMDHMAITALSLMADENEVGFLEGKAHIFPVRHDVIYALSRIAAPSSAEVLVSALQDGEEPETVDAATAGLKKIGIMALPVLGAGMENQPDEVLKSRITALIKALQ